VDEAKEALGCFVVTCCHAPRILEFVEETFDAVSQGVEQWVYGTLQLAVDFVGMTGFVPCKQASALISSLS
jgi:hypothetical protein